MDHKDIEKIMKALKEGGTTIVAGDLVMEKHVEHEIGMVEAGGIGIQVNQGVERVDNGGNKPTSAKLRQKQATFSMVSDVFTYKWAKQHPKRVVDFYQYLVKLRAIDKDTDHEEFEHLFMGVPTDVTVKWIAPKSALKFLMSTLKERGYITPTGKIWKITESHFKDAQDHLFKNLRKEHDPKSLEEVISLIADTLDPTKEVKPIEMLNDDHADELWSGIKEKGYNR